MKMRCLTGLVALVASSAAGDTITVCPDGNCDHATIQDAIDAALDGDTILVQPGTYTGFGPDDPVVDFGGKSLAIIATAGPDLTFIDGKNVRQCVSINEHENENTLLSGFTITRGHADFGGGIDTLNSSPTISNCRIHTNQAVNNGGGVHVNWDSTVSIINCIIEGNEAESGGGIFCWTGSNVTISSCTIADNNASSQGGGVYLYQCELDADTTTISENLANRGGGIYGSESVLRTENATIVGNDTFGEGAGGGLHLYQSTIDLEDTVIRENLGYNGGGIYLADTTFDLRNCQLDDNRTTGVKNGGGICTYGSSGSIIDSSLNGNTASYGGGLYIHSTILIMERCEINSNNAEYGGGMRVYESDIALRETQLRDNTATDPFAKGGGIFLTNPMRTEINGCTLTGNSAWQGGGIHQFAGDICTVTTSTIAGNAVTADGGGILVNQADALLVGLEVSNNTSGNNGAGLHFADGVANVLCCNVTGNTASGSGGGVLCWTNTTALFSDCRIEENTSNFADGLTLHAKTEIRLAGTRVCGNGDWQIDGSWIDDGGNRISDSCPPWCPTDLNDDGIVDGADLAVLLTQWGGTGGENACLAADFDDNLMVDGQDLATLLAAWGFCP